MEVNKETTYRLTLTEKDIDNAVSNPDSFINDLLSSVGRNRGGGYKPAHKRVSGKFPKEKCPHCPRVLSVTQLNKHIAKSHPG